MISHKIEIVYISENEYRLNSGYVFEFYFMYMAAFSIK